MKIVQFLFSTTMSFLIVSFALTGHASEIDSKTQLSLRSRAVHLEQNQQSGKTASLSGRISTEINWKKTASLVIEVDAVESFFEDEYSDGVRFNNKPFIPDVPGLDLNQLKIITQPWHSEFIVGRQTINQYNERFIGSVSIWQNEQTFDALNWQIPIAQSSSFHYRYIGKALRIFGKDAGENLSPSDTNFLALNGQRPLARLGEHEHQTHSLQFDFEEWDYHKWSFFYLNLDNKDVPIQNNETYGTRYRFKLRPDRFTYQVHAILAEQHRKAPIDKYFLLSSVEFGLGIKEATFFAKWEELEGDGNAAFITPLATLHDHQGWADQFTTTPLMGVRDQSLRLLWRKKPARIDIRHHRFKASNSSLNFGSEWDAEITFSLQKAHHVSLQLAHFSANKQALDMGLVEDTTNVIFTYSYSFHAF